MATMTKCVIRSLEDARVRVEACFNPRELAIDKQIPWEEHRAAKGDRPALEFTSAAPATLAVELLFDTFEAGTDVRQDYVAKLERMAQVVDPGSRDADRKRPPRCQFEWGSFQPFAGVIEQLSIRYTMFFADGTPCRALATIKMKEFVAPPPTSRSREPPRPKGALVAPGDALRADRHGPDHRGALAAHGSEDGRLTPGRPVPGRPPAGGAR